MVYFYIYIYIHAIADAVARWPQEMSEISSCSCSTLKCTFKIAIN